MRSILLINPSLAKISSTSFFVMPLGLLSLAVYMRSHSYDVEVLDLNVEKILLSVQERLEAKVFFLVGVSVMVAGQLTQARDVLRIVKKYSQRILTLMGGAHTSQFPKEILNNCPEVDFVVLGEGEEQLLDIADFFYFPRPSKTKIDGIAYRKDKEIIIQSKQRYMPNINTLPTPAYDLMNFADYQQDTSTWHNPYKVDFGVRVPIITSRGCPNSCSFCSVAKCMGQVYRPMTATKVVDLLQSIYENTGAHYFAFFDANFTQDPKRVIDICNKMVRRGLVFQIDLPTGFPINVYSEEMIQALAEVGLIRTGISIESGDSYIRNMVMKKNVEQEFIFKVVDVVRKYPQIFFLTDIILGMPEDTKETLEATYQVVNQLDVDEIVICTATPYGGTALFDQCVKENLFFGGIDPSMFWCADWFSHHEADRFSIKPYTLSLEELSSYKERFKELRILKNALYRKRMLDVFGVKSEWKGRG